MKPGSLTIAGLSGMLLCLQIFTPLAQASQAPNDFTSRYSVTRAGIKIAETSFKLTLLQDGSYLYESHGAPAGVLAWLPVVRANERSHWRLKDGRIRSLSYDYTLHGGGNKNDMSVKFDWPRQKVSIKRKGKLRELDLPEGTVDRFVVQLAVMMDLQQKRKLMEYKFIDRKRLHTYKFRIRGREKVETTLGTFDTVRIESLPGRPNEKRRTIFWSAPELNYMPVKVQQSKRGGATYTMVLEDLQGVESPTIARTRAQQARRNKEAIESPD